MKIAENSKVTIDYTMTLDNGEVVDTTKESEPITYTQGEGELLEGVEKRMAGLAKGDSLDIVLSAEEGFGVSDPEAFIEIPNSDLPPEALKVDAMLEGQGPQGQAIEGRVVELKEDSAVVDFNHPLAGKTLHFSVTVVDVK
jgi:FKBP-type peptidyl-prolyl cis-trans isomerase SlyD